MENGALLVPLIDRCVDADAVAHRVGSLGRFDFHHVGTEGGQVLRAHRSCQEGGEVKDVDPGEGQLIIVSILRAVAGGERPGTRSGSSGRARDGRRRRVHARRASGQDRAIGAG